MTNTIPDIELIQALDFEHVIACESTSCARESQPAHDAAVFMNDSCGCNTPICAPKIANRMLGAQLGYEFYCSRCGTMYITLVRVTPINK